MSTDDVKYFGDGVKWKSGGVRPEVKWTEDALGKSMSMVLEIRYYSYENEMSSDVQGVMSQKNSEEIVKVRLDKMKVGNVSMDVKDVKGLDCDKLKDTCFKTRSMVDCNLYFICVAMQQNKSSEAIEKKDDEDKEGAECKIMRELCRAEEDAEKKEIICEDAERVCEGENSVKGNGLPEIAKCLIACLPKCILFGTGCVVNCVTKCATK